VKRYLMNQIQTDLTSKMVFLGGPRQVGKTTLAKSLLKDKGHLLGYLNWDVSSDREKILKKELPPSSYWIFDELHKFKLWRNYLKGLFDEFKEEKQILVTGSARLDYYRYSGDSLQGRYHYLRLHPLSVSELKLDRQKHFMDLLTLGGFPEPFLKGSAVQSKRWSREYRNRLFRDDITQVEQIQDVGSMELLMIRLPELVGSPLSINSLREDLQTSHKTLSRWIQILDRFYAIILVPPFGAPKIKAVKKEQKHYHWDWTLVQDESLRFENLVACHLLKWVHYLEDTQGRDVELRYFRDIDGREVDFVVTEDRKPILFVECKWNDSEISKGLKYLNARFPLVPAWQISAIGKKDFVTFGKIRVCPAFVFLKDFV